MKLRIGIAALACLPCCLPLLLPLLEIGVVGAATSVLFGPAGTLAAAAAGLATIGVVVLRRNTGRPCDPGACTCGRACSI